ncbi:efflux transporter outer membrane subunit [Coraliomargarita akajimensis]|uniref:efflux transporter outer membrane subunit n=1 Tax=Coraliomargarita akajimensis TaxID=395922 RepID=UPI00145FBD4A|nr:efflux transporter outer membrane subunit [Coraliomargarita akajimensis]
MITAVGLSISLLSSGCYTATEREAEELQALPTDYSRPVDSTTEPESIADTTTAWWINFERDDLNSLQAEALSNNLGLAQAWARLRQAEASARQAGADLYPDLTLNAGYQRTWQETGDTAASKYNAGLNVSYELDVWGKVRAGQQAAGAEAAARAEDLQSTGLTLSANVADLWIQIIELQNRIALLQQQLKINQTQLELVELRFQTSRASSLDVYQQRQTIARTRSELPSTEATLAAAQHSLNLLLGQAATTPLEINWQQAPTLPSLPSIGIPSNLIEQRPDVRAARLRIEQADWNLARAKADRLPSIGLTGELGSTSDQFEELFENWLAKFAANLSAPILDGGRRKLEVEKQLAVVDEAIANYRLTVLTAFKEVEDALMLEQKVGEQLAAVRTELELARKTLDEARNRYAYGLSDYLNVTSALISVQNLERSEITQVANQYKARIDLHKALGGNLYLPQSTASLSSQ